MFENPELPESDVSTLHQKVLRNLSHPSASFIWCSLVRRPAAKVGEVAALTERGMGEETQNSDCKSETEQLQE